jgi:hypothetical protein
MGGGSDLGYDFETNGSKNLPAPWAGGPGVHLWGGSINGGGVMVFIFEPRFGGLE